MGGWSIPEHLITKDIEINEIDSDYLSFFHDQMHVYWNKLEEGFPLYGEADTFDQGWSFIEIHLKHQEILAEMQKRNIPHLTPINALDLVKSENIDKPSENIEKIESISLKQTPSKKDNSPKKRLKLIKSSKK